jgi:long-subunit fatty acid transport protein
MRRRVGILAVAAATVAAASPARASTLDLFGFGIRSPALAGAGVATSDDYESVYANPAGLSEARTKRATIGFVASDFQLELGADDSGGLATGTVLGGVVPMPLGGWAKDRVGFGFGMYVPNDTLTRVRAPFPGQPSFALLDTRARVIAIQLALGVRISERWSVGAGIIALAALTGGIDITTDAGGRFSADSEQRLVTQFAPVAGVRWRPTPRLAAGLVARAPSRSDYDIQVTSDLGDAIPLTLPEIRIAGNAQYDPLTVAAEVAWQWNDLAVMGQLAWQRWSAYPLPTKNPVMATPAQQPAGFHDTVVPRVGAEWVRQGAGTRLAARLGYAFLWSPAPEMTGQQSLLDNHRHLFGVGFGAALTGRYPLRIDLYVQLHQLMARRHVKDAALQPPGEPVPFDAITTRGRILVGGLAMGIDL